MVVMSGDVGCWCALFGTLVGVSVLSVMWLELESVSEISSPRWSSVYERQSVECAFTSPVIIELDILIIYYMQFVMSMVSCCDVTMFLGAMYMLTMMMSLKHTHPQHLSTSTQTSTNHKSTHCNRMG